MEQDKPLHHGHTTMMVTTIDIIFDVLALFAIFLDAAVVFTICRQKKLRTIPNTFIANWAVSDIIVLLGVHVNKGFIHFLEEKNISSLLVALLKNSEFIFHGVTLVFVVATAIDWHLVAYSEEAYHRFQKCRIVVILPWVLGVMYLVDFLIISLNGIYTLPVLMFFCLYTLGFIIIFYINSVRAGKQCRNEPWIQPSGMLILTSVVMVMWLPIWVGLILVHVFEIIDDVRIVTEICYLSTSVVTFLGMLQWNSTYRALFWQMFKGGKNEALRVQAPPPEDVLFQIRRYAEYSV